MRKSILTLLMATIVLPVAVAPASASAQTRRDVQEARQDLREEQRNLNRAYRSGDRKDVREAQRDVREAQRDYNQETRKYQENNRRAAVQTQSRNNGWNAPFRYQRWNKGNRMNASYYAPRYAVNNPQRYRLPNAGRNLRWVRHYDDALLVNTRTGRVVDVRRNIFR